MRQLLKRSVRWLAPVLWMGVIFYLSAQSTLPSFTERPDLQDIAGHFIVYAVLAVLWAHALLLSGCRRPWLWAFLVALLYGVSDEFHQSFVPGRHPDIFDVLTDAVGAGVGLVLFRRALRRGWQAQASDAPAPRTRPGLRAGRRS